jgi:hypothetical protein
MNKRLKELIEETVKTTLLEHSTEYVIISTQSESLGVQHVLSIPIEFCERFAQLIVEECANICYDNEYSTPNKCAWKIEQHFEGE